VASKEIQSRVDRIEALADSDPDLRAQALVEARTAAADPVREVRAAAAGAIAATAEPNEALLRLGRLAADEDVGVRYAAVAAIAGLPWRGRLDLLARALDDDDLGIVAVAADGLSYVNDRRALPALELLLNEKRTQFGALEGLYALRDEGVLPLARQLFTGFLTPIFNKVAAALIVARSGEAPAMEFLLRGAQKRFAAERGFILSHLIDFPSAQGRQILETVAHTPTDDQRESALLALTRSDPARWWPEAEAAIDSAIPEEAPGAGEVLLTLADIDWRRAKAVAEKYRTREDPIGLAARHVRLQASLMDAFPDEVHLR
jgi:HEAT repeat protein